MATALAEEFEPWLYEKLKSLKTDENVFGSYITGILEADDTIEEKKDALEGILAEFVQSDITGHVSEIIEKWSLCRPNSDTFQQSHPTVDVQLSRLMESQSLATTTRREYTDEEKKIREAILKQYSQLSDNEEEVVEEDKNSDLVKNTNVSDVAAIAKERREQARQDAQRKKEKDKEDREKQKQLKEDKKEKRKTQKNERKR